MENNLVKLAFKERRWKACYLTAWFLREQGLLGKSDSLFKEILSCYCC